MGFVSEHLPPERHPDYSRLSDTELSDLAVKRFEAQQKPRELANLLEAVRTIRPRTVVEIGTHRGGTLFGWCQVAEPDATLVSIDLPAGPFGGGYELRDELRFSREFKRSDGCQTLTFMREDSHQASTLQRLQEKLQCRPIDFLFIDGDHSAAGVRQDFEMYRPLVRDGGLIAFHDILPHPGYPDCQVDEVWSGIRQNHLTVEFIDQTEERSYGQWGGIGVVLN